MKAILSIFLLLGSVLMGSAEEKEVWYDASGKVVKVTRAEKVKPRMVPAWEKRAVALQVARDARNDGRVQRTTSGYANPNYHGYGYGYSYPSYGTGWSYRPTYRAQRGHYGGSRHSGHRSHSPFRFSGTYQKNGWSVRLRF